ncbi:MAG TPA: type II toxin-antitoxin system VapC family toxin [Gaiellaceae bacterium]|nr:type II toxin-antitoxin system VapC family toxin [Gaiellaceae bacterium]
MKLVDANVLVYAVDADAANHCTARDWLDAALGGLEPVGFAWIVLLAFLRLTTSAAIFPRPLDVDEATGVVERWLSQPPAVVVSPTPRHLPLLHGLLASTGAAVNLVNDAHLAALALEYGAEIVSFDRDFGRFEGMRWRQPGS